MVKILYALAFLMFMHNSMLQAAEMKPLELKERTMEISVNPIGGLFLGRLSGAFQFKVADQIAMVVPLSLSLWGLSFGTAGNSSSFATWSVYSGIGARFFLSDKAFKSGWFLDAILQLGYTRLNGVGGAFAANPWFLGGYGWVFDSGLAINLGLGIQYNYYTAQGTELPLWIGFPLPVLEASLGYSW